MFEDEIPKELTEFQVVSEEILNAYCKDNDCLAIKIEGRTTPNGFTIEKIYNNVTTMSQRQYKQLIIYK